MCCWFYTAVQWSYLDLHQQGPHGPPCFTDCLTSIFPCQPSGVSDPLVLSQGWKPLSPVGSTSILPPPCSSGGFASPVAKSWPSLYIGKELSSTPTQKFLSGINSFPPTYTLPPCMCLLGFESIDRIIQIDQSYRWQSCFICYSESLWASKIREAKIK